MTANHAHLGVLPAGISEGLLRETVHWASLAPSIHNTQPWAFRLREDGIDVFYDWTRRLAVIDPDGRELQLSVGAALLNLRVALVARGLHPRLVLCPGVEREPDMAAQVRVVGRHQVTPHDRALRAAIPRRHTNRRPFHSRAVDDVVMEALVRAARAEGASMRVADDSHAEKILSLVRSAETQQRQDPDYRAELARWTTTDSARLDGVPDYAFDTAPSDEVTPFRDFATGSSVPRQHTSAMAQRCGDGSVPPVVIVLSTSGDSGLDRLRAGMAMERLCLEATLAGLAVSYFTQPLEVLSMLTLIDGDESARRTQLFLGLGHAAPSSPSPRRPVEAVLLPSRD